jgi:hypothetical protein
VCPLLAGAGIVTLLIATDQSSLTGIDTNSGNRTEASGVETADTKHVAVDDWLPRIQSQDSNLPGPTQLPPEESDTVAGASDSVVEPMITRFSELLYVDSPGFSMEEKIAVEEDILRHISLEPDSVLEFFDLYEHSDDYDYKLALIDVLSMIENPQVEQFALEQVSKEINDHTLSWLQVLRSTGISAQEDRVYLLSNIHQFSDPIMLSNALSALKFRPFPVIESERYEIVSQLEVFLTHENPAVSQAAMAVIDNWNIGSGNHTDSLPDSTLVR